MLLERWMAPPMSFVLLLCATQMDFKVGVLPSIERTMLAQTPEEERQKEQHQQLFQRLKGWVVTHSRGLAFVTLRDRHINFYESRLAWAEVRDQAALNARNAELHRTWTEFVQTTRDVFADFERRNLRPQSAAQSASFSKFASEADGEHPGALEGPTNAGAPYPEAREEKTARGSVALGRGSLRASGGGRCRRLVASRPLLWSPCVHVGDGGVLALLGDRRFHVTWINTQTCGSSISPPTLVLNVIRCFHSACPAERNTRPNMLS